MFRCAKESAKAGADGKIFCNIYLCAKERKLDTCSDCNVYPCEKYDKGIFSEGFIKWIKEKLRES
ncbi:MAG: DUF3795 domain-containing protein [Candidatus Bathycorpusculaceae bacterium]